jgi:50S ribosomal protein L16 3-hydroxylase
MRRPLERTFYNRCMSQRRTTHRRRIAQGVAGDATVLRTLGDLTVSRFMREFWQRRPLLVRNALPGFAAPVGPARLLQLASVPDAESRLVEQRDGRWRVTHGPLVGLPSPRRRGWTVLLQGLDLLDDDAHALLARFRFVPDARLDDLMASYATDGGGVGPHVDSYDVFLLQAHGRRRWRWGRQRDVALRPDVPLALLARFAPTHEAVLEPGDLLYLPPGVAHEGTALGECVTYSIGFRAPAFRELVEPALVDFASRTAPAGRYRDAGQPVARQPAALPARLIEATHRAITQRRPRRGDTARFLLAHLSEPKAQVIFDPPARPLDARAFAARASAHGLQLDRRTRLLYRGGAVGINGEVIELPASVRRAVRKLADTRSLTAAPPAAMPLLHDWYRAGWVHLAPKPFR